MLESVPCIVSATCVFKSVLEIIKPVNLVFRIHGKDRGRILYLIDV